MPDVPQEDLIRYGVMALVAIVVIWGISKLMPKKSLSEDVTIPRSCKKCGWTGRASKFVLKCPKCGGSLELP
jgi:predicted Zn-ribbon and HTH transcriptional regulator